MVAQALAARVMALRAEAELVMSLLPFPSEAKVWVRCGFALARALLVLVRFKLPQNGHVITRLDTLRVGIFLVNHAS